MLDIDLSDCAMALGFLEATFEAFSLMDGTTASDDPVLFIPRGMEFVQYMYHGRRRTRAETAMDYRKAGGVTFEPSGGAR
jgi:hypothetical protein